eukprot:CAMPEP_0177667400 /NCGR_PEP_ID=MMETSP0447-20121125/22102_1 /TAXON_ID=0 /ORGANISM="Stygamoeba regulata, Strain BSH-02190019" /LENGTH=116 /DNA_ID=CAMNT_0019173627 /DNA_START=643 /DNA_END=993 /DNA_ORIENTATION=-
MTGFDEDDSLNFHLLSASPSPSPAQSPSPSPLSPSSASFSSWCTITPPARTGNPLLNNSPFVRPPPPALAFRMDGLGSPSNDIVDLGLLRMSPEPLPTHSDMEDAYEFVFPPVSMC